VGGGCINPTARLETDTAGRVFAKWSDEAPREMFEAEADGLAALREAGGSCGLHVPEVLGLSGDGEGGYRWLLLEWVDPGRQAPGHGEALGRGLAGLHRAGRENALYGWRRGNFIGSLAQDNPRGERWPDFWRDARLHPQLVRARASGHFAGGHGQLLDRLLDRVAAALAEAEADGASLLHGDLWNGNVFAGAGGRPVLIDPATYRGHREVDLAMSELFGGFPPGYLEAYREAWPLDAAYRRVRRPLYQLYYLLVHVNLFGASYMERTLAATRQVLAEL
jgi:fructosamine-3-kinase